MASSTTSDAASTRNPHPPKGLEAARPDLRRCRSSTMVPHRLGRGASHLQPRRLQRDHCFLPRRLLAAVVPFIVLFAGCGELGDLPTAPPTDDPEVPSATFTRVQTEIFTPTCALSGCHNAASQSVGLILTADRSYGLLVNRPSTEIPQLLRVAPGNPDMSYLYWKITGRSGIVGEQMPRTGMPLSQAQQDLIRDWIARGAPND